LPFLTNFLWCDFLEQVQQHPAVALTAEQAAIPGLQLHLDFITAEQEAALLQHIEQQPWQQLSKRRVQHYGYCFDYSQRGVDAQQRLGPLPEWVEPLVQRMEVGVKG
jgi:alkylated DNA repair protein alkB family protein 8